MATICSQPSISELQSKSDTLRSSRSASQSSSSPALIVRIARKTMSAVRLCAPCTTTSRTLAPRPCGSRTLAVRPRSPAADCRRASAADHAGVTWHIRADNLGHFSPIVDHACLIRSVDKVTLAERHKGTFRPARRDGHSAPLPELGAARKRRRCHVPLACASRERLDSTPRLDTENIPRRKVYSHACSV